jgi:hypothetical protein
MQILSAIFSITKAEAMLSFARILEWVSRRDEQRIALNESSASGIQEMGVLMTRSIQKVMARGFGTFLVLGLWPVLVLAGAPRVAAQPQDNAQGPIAPPPTFEVRRIPSVPHPGPPPMPMREIIAKFAAHEDVAKKVYEGYRFQQTIRIEEEGGGKLTANGEVYTHADGGRFWRSTAPLASNLKIVKYSLEDVHTMTTVPLFFLTSDEVANYDFVYAGQQKLDEVNAYIFQVKPKMLSRTRRLFQGVIFVDDRDLAIVETFGKFVADMPASDDSKLPFSLFEVYRENFQDKYWLPTYIHSDDYIHSPDQDDLHLTMVIRSTDFKLDSPAPASIPAGVAPLASGPKP